MNYIYNRSRSTIQSLSIFESHLREQILQNGGSIRIRTRRPQMAGPYRDSGMLFSERDVS